MHFMLRDRKSPPDATPSRTDALFAAIHRASWTPMTCFLWIVAGLSLIAVLSLIPILLRAPLVVDQLLYFAEGRSILNGLHPWKDLFETKPPVIYWISALSILTGATWLYFLIALAGLCGMIGCTAWTARDSESRGLAIIITCALALFAVIETNGYEPEIFGLLPATVGVLAFVNRRELLSAGCLALLVLLKEPFVLTYGLALLLFVDSRVAFLSLVRVVIIGISLQLAILFLTGDLANYLFLYLPEMLFGRVSELALYHDYRDNSFHVVAAPVYIRGLSSTNFREYLLNGLFFGIGMIILVGASFFLLRKSWKDGLLAIGAVLLSIGVMQQVFTMEQVLALLHWSIPFASGFFRWKLAELSGCVLFLLILGIVLFFRNRGVLWDLVKIVLAFYGMFLADTVGNTNDRYLLFSFPLWIALVYVLISAKPGRLQTACTLVLGVTLAVNLYPLAYTAQGRVDPTIVASQPVIQRNARIVDEVMDACRIDRYLLAIDTYIDQSWYVVGLTKHSPYQIFWGNQRVKDRGHDGDIIPASPYFMERMVRDINHAQFAVGAGYEDFPYADVDPQFMTDFTQMPPACAEKVLNQQRNKPLKFYFRKAPA